MSEETKPNPAEGFQKILEKHNNDATRLAAQLWDDNFQLREKNRTLEGQIPKDGSLVLTADEAKKWKGFNDLGKEPKEIKKDLERLPTLESDNRELSRAESIREASSAMGYKPSVLKSLLKDFPDAVFNFKDETDAKTKEVRKVPYIALEGKESSLEDFANSNFADFLPALKVEATTTTQRASNGNDPPPAGAGNFLTRYAEKVKKEFSDKPPAADIDARFGRPSAV